MPSVNKTGQGIGSSQLAVEFCLLASILDLIEDFKVLDPSVGFIVENLFISGVKSFEMLQRRFIIMFSFIDFDQALMDQGDIGQRIYFFGDLQSQKEFCFGLVQIALDAVNAADL